MVIRGTTKGTEKKILSTKKVGEIEMELFAIEAKSKIFIHQNEENNIGGGPKCQCSFMPNEVKNKTVHFFSRRSSSDCKELFTLLAVNSLTESEKKLQTLFTVGQYPQSLIRALDAMFPSGMVDTFLTNLQYQ